MIPALSLLLSAPGARAILPGCGPDGAGGEL